MFSHGWPFATARAMRTSQVIECFQVYTRVQFGGAFSALSGRERMSATLQGTRQLAPAVAGRWFGKKGTTAKTVTEPPLVLRTK